MSVDTNTIRSHTDPLIERVIDDRYKIVRVLGEGGMGMIYEARHAVLGTRLAIKILRDEVWGDEEALARLKREAQTASAIGHENIVDVRDFGRLEDGSTYEVMELIDGEDVLKRLRREGPFEWEAARRIALQICAALGAAHEAGIVHRDLKPENVILTTKNGRADFVKIVDFGIALLEGAAKITQAGRVVGTPEYMSPEQCAGVQVDHRADIYALGILLYEMTTGRLPFAHTDILQLVRMHMQDAPAPPTELNPDIPEGFEAVILRCLAKRPHKRFQLMEDVAAALGAIESAPIEAPPAGDLSEPEPMLRESGTIEVRGQADTVVVPPAAEPIPPREARATWPLLAFAAVAAIGGAAVGFLLIVPGADDEPPVEAAAEPPSTRPTPDPAAGAGSPEPAPTPEAPASPPQLTIVTEPAGAEVYLDGALVGNTPHRIVRPSGDERVTLLLRADGYEDAEIALSALSSENLRLELHREAPSGRRGRAPPPEETGENEPASQGARRGGPGRRGHQPFLDPWSRPSGR